MVDTPSERKNKLYEEYPYAKESVVDSLENAKRYRNKRVLIAGCGAGSRVFDLHFYGADVTAIDQSSAAIEFIRSQFEELEIDDPPELIRSNLQTHEYRADEYDHILCIGVLHHTTAEREILEKFRDAVKDDGTIELLLYHSGSPVGWERRVVEQANKWISFSDFVPEEVKRRVNWEDKYENPYWKTYTMAEARRLCQVAGLTVQQQWLAGVPFGTITRAIVPEVVRYPLNKLFRNRRWQVRIHCSPKN
jgi:SAM-dependent methyltransferase